MNYDEKNEVIQPIPTAAYGDSIDWKNISADEIYTRVTGRVGVGSIIQFHTGTEHTAEALPEILQFIADNNYIPVTVGELIFSDRYKIDNNGRQIPCD